MGHIASVARAVGFALVALAPGRVLASTYTYTSFDIPNSFSFATGGINNAGQVVGSYIPSGSNPYNSELDVSFLYDPTSNSFTSLNDPAGIYGTDAYGINNRGQIVGQFGTTGLPPYLMGLSEQSFLFDTATSTYTTLNPTQHSTATGINDLGQVVGYIGTQYLKSFLLDTATGNLTTLADPLAPAVGDTIAEGINNAGQIFGYYTSPTTVGIMGSYYGGTSEGFLYTISTGTYTEVAEPNASGNTYAVAINNLGQIVGTYADASNNVLTFLYDPASGSYTDLTSPADSVFGPAGAVFSEVTGINDSGQIVGYYTDGQTQSYYGNDFYIYYGFIATPVAATLPEPSSLPLLGIGFTCTWLAQRRRLRTTRSLSMVAD